MRALIEAAIQARDRAHAPFSEFRVGAAVADEQGRIFTGCNIESASYGLTLCAERVAVFKAVSEGAADLVGILPGCRTGSSESGGRGGAIAGFGAAATAL